MRHLLELRCSSELISSPRFGYSKLSVAALAATMNAGLMAHAQSGGAADLTFNGTGQTTVQLFGLYDRAYDVALQADGKIIAVGDGHDRTAVLRFNTDGTPDLSFGNSGQFVFAAGTGLWSQIHVLPDQRILVGFLGAFGRGMSILRLMDDGTLDTTFGANGEANAFWGSYVTGMIVQPDGRIVLAGYQYFSGTGFDFTMTRFTENGLQDTTFGVNGRVTTDFTRPAISAPDDKLYSLTVMPDGSLVAAGSTTFGGGISGTSYALARYDPNGHLETGFAQAGKSVFTYYKAGQPWSSEYIEDLVALPDGRLLGVGSGGITGGAVLRLLPDGSPDPCFGQGGLVLTRLGQGNDWYNALTLDRYGRILALGTQVDNRTGTQKVTLVRHRPDGTLDSSFGTGGTVTTTTGGSYDYGEAIALDAESRIIVAGSAGNDFMVGRRLPGPPPNLYSVQLSPLDGLASTNNGSHWSITDGDISINVYRDGYSHTQRRGILEFPLQSIPADARINSARLDLYVNTFTYSGSDYPNVHFYGYLGNGALSPADAALSGSLAAETGPVTALGPISLNLDPAYLESLLALPSPWLGLTAYGSVENRQTGFFTVESPIPDTAPMLTIEYLRPILKHDFDQDSDVDLGDLSLFEPCLSGGGIPPTPCCRDQDQDADGDVDMDDFARLQRCYSGPGEAPHAQCADW